MLIYWKRSLLLLMITLMVGCFPPIEGDGTSTLIRTIDGDTYVDNEGRTIRLAGIDSPERGEAGFIEARIALRDQLIGEQITLAIVGTDRYNRVVGCVYVRGMSVDAFMISKGHARAWIGVDCEEDK